MHSFEKVINPDAKKKNDTNGIKYYATILMDYKCNLLKLKLGHPF